MAAVASTERHLSSRIDRLEATVNAHDDLIQQLRGARNLLALIFGTSVLTAVLGLLTLLGPTMPRWRQAPARPYLVAHWYW